MTQGRLYDKGTFDLLLQQAKRIAILDRIMTAGPDGSNPFFQDRMEELRDEFVDRIVAGRPNMDRS